MTRLSRVLCAPVLAFAIGAVPLVADWCADACEASHAATPAAAPACHHSGSALPHAGDVPAPCSHDHHPVVVDAATTLAVASRTAAAVPSVSAGPSPSARSIAALDDPAGRHVLSAFIPLTLASILRI